MGEENQNGSLELENSTTESAVVSASAGDNNEGVLLLDNSTSNSSSKQQVLCFHCGKEGHNTATCSLRGVVEQNGAGKAAFDAYLKYVSTFNKKKATTKKGPGQKKRNRNRMYHLHQLREWMATHRNHNDDNYDDDNTPAVTGDAATESVPAVYDPISLVQQQHPRFHTEQDFQVVKHLHHSYRKFFNAHMERIRQRFNARDDMSTNDAHFSRRRKGEHDQVWQTALNEAVRHGMPANFSRLQDNWIYADNKLIPRSRYLYYLLLDDNAISTRLRKRLLLPRLDGVSNDNGAADCEDKGNTSELSSMNADRPGGNVVRVCSIGGGPGYDHLAIALASWFLYKVQPGTNADGESSSSHALVPRTIQTQVFDLYHQEWLPMMEKLQECLEGEAETEIIQPKETEWWRHNRMTMHHGDLRLSLFDDDNNDESTSWDDEYIQANATNATLLTSVRAADIIVFQFVLHENASFLVDHETGLFVGTTASILDGGAKKGTFLICTDSSNTLWPALKKTANTHGWEFLGDAEAHHKISLGPKAYVVLEKMR